MLGFWARVWEWSRAIIGAGAGGANDEGRCAARGFVAILRRARAPLHQNPRVAAGGRLDQVEHAPGLPRHGHRQQSEMRPQRPAVGGEAAAEFPETGGMAAGFPRVAIAARRPAFGFERWGSPRRTRAFNLPHPGEGGAIRALAQTAPGGG